jgi:hypothetical protein
VEGGEEREERNFVSIDSISRLAELSKKGKIFGHVGGQMDGSLTGHQT